MALENREGHTYYYRKRRKDGRVVSEYAGRGMFAYVIANFETAQRQEQQIAQEAETFRRQQHKQRGQGLNEYERLAQLVTRAALVASGCRTHKRQWRKRRE